MNCLNICTKCESCVLTYPTYNPWCRVCDSTNVKNKHINKEEKIELNEINIQDFFNGC